MTQNNCRYTDSTNGKTNYLIDPYDFPVIAANSYNFPNNLKSIQGFHPEYLKLIQFNFNNQVKSMGKFSSHKEKLYKRQKGTCSLCNTYLEIDNIEESDLHIDHVIPISQGGSKSNITNMRLVHKYCHIKHHNSGEKRDK